jgi:hypothetical protein
MLLQTQGAPVKFVRTLPGILAAAAAATIVLAMTFAGTAPAIAAVTPSDSAIQPWSVLSRPPVKPALRAPALATARAQTLSAADIPGAAEILRDGITLLHQRTPVTAEPVTGEGVTRSDFDGDGRDDIAAFSDAGVFVSYSSAPHRDRLVTELPGGSGCSCFGWDMVTGNFDGDSYADLAIGDPDEADLRQLGYHAGAVWIFSGGPGGLQVDTVQHVNQSTAGVPGSSAETDWFGTSLATGDITGDGRDELAVGIPMKKVGKKIEAGAVVVLKGSAAGIVTSGARWLDQNTSGVPGAAQTRDHFGASIAIGNVNKDKYRDVVIGAPQEDDGVSAWGSGQITQLWGSSAGVSLTKATYVSGQKATSAAGIDDVILWYLGGNLAIVDTNGDGYGEVIDGDSSAEVDWELTPGAVVSLAGRGTGLSANGVIVLSQDSLGVTGATEDDDHFGDSIAVGDVTGDGLGDVVVGVPGEDLGKVVDAGSVVLLRGSRKGLTGVGSQSLSQSSAGVPGAPERGDTFGSSVSLLNLNGAGGLDALIGSPEELVAGDTTGYSSGTVTGLIGSANGLGAGTVITGRSLGLDGSRYGLHLAHQ